MGVWIARIEGAEVQREVKVEVEVDVTLAATLPFTLIRPPVSPRNLGGVSGVGRGPFHVIDVIGVVTSNG